MKTLLILLLPVLVAAQYWGERPNEKGFEQSALYFSPFHLNPFGIYQFDKITPGLVDDPFLNSQLNPAYIPDDSLQANQFYLDFRGDRSEAEIGRYAVPTPYYDNTSSVYIPPDPRWYSETRTEPEPLVSAGLNKMLTNHLWFSAAYQFLYKEETFYQTPTWIYNARYGMDEKGSALTDNGQVPVVDRSAGEDQMYTNGHLLSVTLAWRPVSFLQAGISANTVLHTREGSYGKLHADRYSEQEDRDEWFNSYLTERKNTYRHIDLGGGLAWHVSDKLTIGTRMHYLQGRARQNMSTTDSSLYHYDWSYNNDISEHNSFRSEKNKQHWKHEGQTYGGQFNFDYRITPDRSVHFHYRYDKRNIDLSNRSAISDTSRYDGNYQNDNYQSAYNSWYRMWDNRSATGKEKGNGWQAMLAFHWFEQKRTQINFGLMFEERYLSKRTSEPVMAVNRSYYHHQYIDNDEMSSYEQFYRLNEDKTLEWRTSTTRRTLQIPVMLNIHMHENWNLMLAVNRIWQFWQIKEQTTAYFKLRDENDNGEIDYNENFGERWSEPTRTISEDDLAFLSGLNIKVSPAFQINIMASPEFEPQWRIAQWWLGFRAAL